MKNITEQAQNKVNLVGKVLDISFGEGKTKDGRDYGRATVTLRVNQTYGGREEISEIPVSFFAMQFTSTHKPNPAYATIQQLKRIKTAQNDGIDEAAILHCTGASLRENNFVAKSGQFISGFQVDASFANEVSMAEVAAFVMDIFIMDMHPEADREDDPTGRLVIKGGVVQYGGRLDVLEFIVEEPNSVDYIERNWEINDTVTIKGRIRVTAVEEKNSGTNSSWGEDVPETTTRTVRELIITKGDDQGKDEEFAYDPVEIKKAFNVRKAKIEQMQLDAQQKSKPAATAPAATATATSSQYSWE